MTTTLCILLGVAAIVGFGTGLLQALLKLVFTGIFLVLGTVCKVIAHVIKYILVGLGFILGGLVWVVLQVLPYRRQTVYNAFKKVAADCTKILQRVFDVECKQRVTDKKVENLIRIWGRINEINTRFENLIETIGVEDDGDGDFSVSNTDGELAKINDGFEALCRHLGVTVKQDSDGVHYVAVVPAAPKMKDLGKTKARRTRKTR